MTTRLVAASAALLLLGGTMASAQTAADGDFAKFVEDYFAARYADRPSEGTAQGFHEYDSKPW